MSFNFGQLLGVIGGGNNNIIADESIEYLHRGISSRNFLRTWTLAEHVEVRGAEVKNGILLVQLERKVPEEQRPKKIAITYSN